MGEGHQEERQALRPRLHLAHERRLRIPAIDNTISRVCLLNNPSVSLSYTVTDQINVTVPATAPNANVSVVCVEVQGMPVSVSATVSANVNYEGARAVLHLGSYPSSQLTAVGLGPAMASSILVADGLGSTSNGDPVRQKAWDGSNTQQWQIIHRGQGQYSIANRSTGLALDGGGLVAAGAVTKQWT